MGSRYILRRKRYEGYKSYDMNKMFETTMHSTHVKHTETSTDENPVWGTSSAPDLALKTLDNRCERNEGE